MASGETLIDLIRKVIAKTGNDGFITGKVTAVDKKNLTCEIEFDDNLLIQGCRLSSVVKETPFNHYALFPKIGSYVSAVATADLRDVLIVSVSEVESIAILADKVMINDFKTQLDKMSARIDGIIDAINNGTPGAQDGGAALLQSIKLGLQQITDKEDFNTLADYESD